MKKLMACILAASCFAVMGGCAAANTESIISATVSQSDTVKVSGVAATTQTASNSSTYIGETKAKSLALKHAGLTELEVTYVKSKLDYDDGRTVYDIEFYVGNAEYDYEVDAYSGDILSYDYDIDNYTAASVQGDDSKSIAPAPVSQSDTVKVSGVAATTQTASNSSIFIGETKAKALALKHAGLTESEVTYVKAKLDYDDGQTVYDIEFYVGNAEYDYEVDAYSGDILSYDYDIDIYTAASVQNGGSAYISLGEAKAIALKKANLTAKQVTYTEASFEYDDGIAVYQIDFISDGIEYEFEINAVDQTIVEYDVESQYN